MTQTGLRLKANIKKVYGREYFIFLCIGYLPILWKFCQIAFLTSFANSLKILGQVALISIIFKIFQETLINPLYKTLGKSNVDEEQKCVISKKFLWVYSALTLFFTLVIFACLKPIIKASQVPDYIFEQTLVFLKIYVFGCGLNIISQYLFTLSLIGKETKKLFVYLLINSIATLMLLIIFVPSWSLGFGINGVAITNIIVYLASIIYLLIRLPKTSNKPKGNFSFKNYFKLMILSFCETMIRNIVYYCVILVFLNIIDNQDLYYVSNEFIWSVMLVPVLAQNNVIKQAVANNKDESLKPYFINTIFLTLFMFLLVPVAYCIFRFAYNLPNYLDYFVVLLKFMPCYILFNVDAVIESYFFASGQIHHVLIQNVITNVLVYLLAYILYLFNVWTITLDAIILLFSLGVIFSSCYTIVIYILQITRRKKCLNKCSIAQEGKL